MNSKERWLLALKGWRDEYENKTKRSIDQLADPKEFAALIQKVQLEAVHARENSPGRSAEEVVAAIRSSGHYNNVCSSYRAAFICAKELSSLRIQEDRADAWEKLRFLIFRTATALMLGAMILLVSWLAQRWGIPLPFRAMPI